MIENDWDPEEWDVAGSNYFVDAAPDEDLYEIQEFIALPDGWINLSHTRDRLSTCPGVLKVRYAATDFEDEHIAFEAAAFGTRGLEPAWKVHEGQYANSVFKAIIY